MRKVNVPGRKPGTDGTQSRYKRQEYLCRRFGRSPEARASYEKALAAAKTLRGCSSGRRAAKDREWVGATLLGSDPVSQMCVCRHVTSCF